MKKFHKYFLKIKIFRCLLILIKISFTIHKYVNLLLVHESVRINIPLTIHILSSILLGLFWVEFLDSKHLSYTRSIRKYKNLKEICSRKAANPFWKNSFNIDDWMFVVAYWVYMPRYSLWSVYSLVEALQFRHMSC